MVLIEAMAHQEGYFGSDPEVRPRRNNNPLDLIYGTESRSFGAKGGDPEFAIFPDAITGWRAGARWLSVPARFDREGNLAGGYLGAKLRQVIFRFAPPSQNNSQAYLDYVCENTGYTEDTVLTAAMLQLPEVAA